MPEKFDPMTEIWKILLDWMRRQASQVILLSGCIYFMWQIGTEQLSKQEAKIVSQEARIEEMFAEVRKCDAERAALQVEVTAMRYQIEVLMPRRARK